MIWYQIDNALFKKEIENLMNIDPSIQKIKGENDELIVSMSLQVGRDRFKLSLQYLNDYSPSRIPETINVKFESNAFTESVMDYKHELDQYIREECEEGRITSGGELVMGICSWIEKYLPSQKKYGGYIQTDDLYTRRSIGLKYVETKTNEKCNLVVISDRAYRQLVCQTFAVCERNVTDGVETGGVLIGHYVDGFWYVVESIDQGVDTYNTRSNFKYDVDYINHQVDYLSRIYKHPLTILGIWHRHPSSMDHFSGTDEITIKKHVDISDNGILSMLVNIDPAVRMTFYYCGKDNSLMKIPYVAGDEYFIKDLIQYRRLSDISKEYGNVKFVIPDMPDANEFVHSLEERKTGRKDVEKVDEDINLSSRTIDKIVDMVVKKVMNKMEGNRHG